MLPFLFYMVIYLWSVEQEIVIVAFTLHQEAGFLSWVASVAVAQWWT